MTKNESIQGSVNRRIWTIRRESGLTDAGLIKLTGLSNGWWGDRRKGKIAPRRSTVKRLCDTLGSEIFGLTVEWIMDGRGADPDWRGFRNLMDAARPERMVNVVREAGERYGHQARHAAVMTREGDPLPVAMGGNLQETIVRLSELTGIPEKLVRDHVGEMIRKEGKRE